MEQQNRNCRSVAQQTEWILGKKQFHFIIYNKFWILCLLLPKKTMEKVLAAVRLFFHMRQNRMISKAVT